MFAYRVNFRVPLFFYQRLRVRVKQNAFEIKRVQNMSSQGYTQNLFCFSKKLKNFKIAFQLHQSKLFLLEMYLSEISCNQLQVSFLIKTIEIANLSLSGKVNGLLNIMSLFLSSKFQISVVGPHRLVIIVKAPDVIEKVRRPLTKSPIFVHLLFLYSTILFSL